MSLISEKVAYLQGLAEGLKINGETPEGKLLTEIINVLGNISDEIEAIDDAQDELYDKVFELEDAVYGEEDDDECYCDEDWDEDEECEEGFDFGDEDSTIYEVVCACGTVINFDEETLEKGSIICENCGETLEFSLEDEDEE